HISHENLSNQYTYQQIATSLNIPYLPTSSYHSFLSYLVLFLPSLLSTFTHPTFHTHYFNSSSFFTFHKQHAQPILETLLFSHQQQTLHTFITTTPQQQPNWLLLPKELWSHIFQYLSATCSTPYLLKTL